MERRCDARKLLGRAPETELANDELALPVGESVHGSVELGQRVVPCGIARRIDGVVVGEQLVERRLERQPAGRRCSGLDDDLERELQRPGDLDRRRKASPACSELCLGPVDRAPPLDDPLGQPDETGCLGERVANGAADVEARVRLEVDAA